MAEPRPSTETLPPSYNPDRLPAYTPPAPRENPRFAKHDNDLTDLYQRCAEEQAAVEASQKAADEYIAQQIAQGGNQQTVQPKSRDNVPDAASLNALERWNQWSAKYYAPSFNRWKKP